MTISNTVSVQYNGRFLPDIILLTLLCDFLLDHSGEELPSGNPIKCLEEFLSLQPRVFFVLAA